MIRLQILMVYGKIQTSHYCCIDREQFYEWHCLFAEQMIFEPSISGMQITDVADKKQASLLD